MHEGNRGLILHHSFLLALGLLPLNNLTSSGINLLSDLKTDHLSFYHSATIFQVLNLHNVAEMRFNPTSVNIFTFLFSSYSSYCSSPAYNSNGQKKDAKQVIDPDNLKKMDTAP